MYVGFVTLTMLVLPVASILIEHGLVPAEPVILLAGRWFVFWGVGVRLAVAGLRQVWQPAFTARTIFRIENEAVLPLVVELGTANIATGVIGLVSILAPSFVLPAAVTAAIFYGVAGVRHLGEKDRSRNEEVALWSDLWMAAVLAIFIVWSVAAR